MKHQVVSVVTVVSVVRAYRDRHPKAIEIDLLSTGTTGLDTPVLLSDGTHTHTHTRPENSKYPA